MLRNLDDSTTMTVVLLTMSGERVGGPLLKSLISSTVLRLFSSKLLVMHKSCHLLSACKLHSVLDESSDGCIICKPKKLNE